MATDDETRLFVFAQKLMISFVCVSQLQPINQSISKFLEWPK